MSTLTIQLPESLKNTIEALAAKEGYSVSQFLASAAGEKLAVVMTMNYLRDEAAGRPERGGYWIPGRRARRAALARR